MNGWVPLSLAASAARRPRATLRTWVRRGRVSAACRLDGTLVVWWPDVFDATCDAPYRAARRRVLDKIA